MKPEIKQATENDLDIIHSLILELATYEKRPEDFTATKEALHKALFETQSAIVLLAYMNEEVIGYAMLYPIFASFAAKSMMHLEDMYLKETYRGQGLGSAFMKAICSYVLANHYEGLEWSSLDWNVSSHAFYKAIGAKEETNRKYFGLDKIGMEKVVKD